MSPHVTEGRPVLVLVEDETLVRMFTSDFLDQAEFKVFEASNAEEALALLEARSDVQVLMTDVEMGREKRNGFELAHEVRARWPRIVILIVSGQAAPGIHDLPDGAAFISKPYQPTGVIHAIRGMLMSQRERNAQL